MKRLYHIWTSTYSKIDKQILNLIFSSYSEFFFRIFWIQNFFLNVVRLKKIVDFTKLINHLNCLLILITAKTSYVFLPSNWTLVWKAFGQSFIHHLKKDKAGQFCGSTSPLSWPSEGSFCLITPVSSTDCPPQTLSREAKDNKNDNKTGKIIVIRVSPPLHNTIRYSKQLPFSFWISC